MHRRIPSCIHYIIQLIRKLAGITTHLLEKGTDIRYIKDLLVILTLKLNLHFLHLVS
jgi:hypothetical protein